VAIKQFPKNPTVVLILVQGLEGLSVVNIETQKDRRNCTSDAIILKNETTKFHVLHISHRGFLQDQTCIEFAKGCVHRVNGDF
jgi:hypothetical protein